MTKKIEIAFINEDGQKGVAVVSENDAQFLETLLTLRGGQLFELFAEATRECVLNTQHIKNKTKVSLTLTLENKQDDLLLTGEIDKKIPQRKTLSEYIFADDCGDISRNNPNQLSLLNSKGQIAKVA